MGLNTLNQYALAMELLSLGARISIVAKETGLSSVILRTAYVDMHQRSPLSGPMKTSPRFMLKSSRKLKESTLYVVFFYLENAYNYDTCRRSINAYRRYASYLNDLSRANPLLDFSDAWLISKWVESGILTLVRCGHCRSAKIITNKPPHAVCSVCRQ